ncbi:MAG: hypothetical protein PHV07_08030 [Oscillospiraceae bacterium]|nr:hypothetical protein [Oscillospiraceae bacterium]
MTRILKIELKRAFCNKLFLISVVIGCLIAITHVGLDTVPLASKLKITNGCYIFSVFDQWIGLKFTFWTSLFFTIFPLLASIPFADSFLVDRKSGYIKNILTRTSKKNYYISKFIAVFLSGGFAVAIPLVFDFYLTSLFIPAVIPDISSGEFPLVANSTWVSIFYTHPFVYVFLYLLLIFVVSGILASVALAFSFIIKYQYVIALTPFLCFLAISFASLFFSDFAMDIRTWIMPQQAVPTEFKYVITEMLILVLFIIFGYFFRGKHDETY